MHAFLMAHDRLFACLTPPHTVRDSMVRNEQPWDFLHVCSRTHPLGMGLGHGTWERQATEQLKLCSTKRPHDTFAHPTEHTGLAIRRRYIFNSGKRMAIVNFKLRNRLLKWHPFRAKREQKRQLFCCWWEFLIQIVNWTSESVSDFY